MAVSRGRDHQLHYQEVITLIIFISFLLQALRPAPAAWWSEQVWGRWRLGMGRDYRCEEIAWSEIIIDVISVIISLVSRYSRHDCTGPVSAASWSPPRLAPQFHPISNLNLYLLPAERRQCWAVLCNVWHKYKCFLSVQTNVSKAKRISFTYQISTFNLVIHDHDTTSIRSFFIAFYCMLNLLIISILSRYLHSLILIICNRL